MATRKNTSITPQMDLTEALKIFGFQIGKGYDGAKISKTFAIPQLADGTVNIQSGGVYGHFVDLEGVAKSVIELITRYREISYYPEVDQAIEEIINSSIVVENDEPPVKLDLDELEGYTDDFKDQIHEEFDNVLNLPGFEFKNNGHDIFRRWYVDGRIYYNIMLGDNPRDGITELRYIDPRRLRKVREITKRPNENGVEVITGMQEYYVYNERGIGTQSQFVQSTGMSAQGLRVAPDSIADADSGETDMHKNIVISYLHKAIRGVNQLRMIEDAVIIYKLSRAPQRRIFYVDVGDLPPGKAMQYVNDLMNKYRNKVVYDADTGCLAMDTPIPLLDGRVLSLRDIKTEFESGKKLWAYSCNPKTGKFAPGLITWAGVTHKSAKVLRITLDNGKIITSTLDHNFPVWLKGKTEAKDLVIGDSLIPFYTRNKKIGGKTTSTYQQIFENESNKWLFTHRLVSKWKDENDIENEFIFDPKFQNAPKLTIHHKNYSRYNNNPDNLAKMNRDDHFLFHKQHNSLAGKIGGKVAGKRAKILGTGFFGFTFEQRSTIGKMSGFLGGKKSYKNKSGIHGLSREKILENSLKGSKTLQEKLLNDEAFKIKFSESLKNSWTNEARKNTSERGKKLPFEHFSKMGKIANECRWNGPNNNLYRDKLSQSQTIEYPIEVLNSLEFCSKNNYKTDQIISYLNSQGVLLEEFRNINKNKTTHLRGDLSNLLFNYEDILRISKKNGFRRWVPFKKYLANHNHKIVNIEYLEEPIEVGTLTIDGNEIYHNYHTFALESGIYTYNSIRDDKKFLSMMEDFWMPRRNGSQATTIDTLEGASSFADMDELNYFLERVMKSLNVPLGRLRSDSGFQLGRPSEISNEERKFNKFIVRIRKRFAMLFDKLLMTQLILKGIINKQDWLKIRPFIHYDFLKDSYFAELEDSEILMNRATVVTQLQELVGVYYSKEYVRKKVLKQTDEDIKEIDKQIAKEAKQPIALPQSAQAELEMQKQLIGTQTDAQSDLATDQAGLQMKMQQKQAEMEQNQQLQQMMTQAQLQQREPKPSGGKK